MSGLIKYRVHEVAKDFGMTSKEITQILTDYATTPKNHMQVLEDDELNDIFEYLTQRHQAASLEELYKVPDQPKAKPQAAPAAQGAAPKGEAAPAKQPQQAAQPQQQHKPKKDDKPHQPRQVAERRVVDTRGSAGANLSKYDERFDKIAGNAGNAGKDKDIRRGGKEKIQNKNKQRQQQVASAKRRQEERDKMQRLQFEVAKKQQLKVSIPDEINVGELASRMKKTAVEVIKQLIKLGVMASVSDVIDYDTAALVAMELHGLLPALETPYYTENYEGFYHLVAMRGETEQAELQYIIRDHDRAKFEARKAVMEKACAEIDRRYGAGTAALTLRDSYYNMKEKIAPCMFLIENAKKAMESVGVTPKIVPIRGGTDGARLSFEGLPCPNLCTGGENYHGRYEYACVQSMEKTTELLIAIAAKYANR